MTDQFTAKGLRGAEALKYAKHLRKAGVDAERWEIEYMDDGTGDRCLTVTMNEPQQDVYAAVVELIADLNAQGHHKLASILEHRMYKVPWASSSELFEELKKVLTNALTEYKSLLDNQSIDKIRSIVAVLDGGASK